MANQLTLLNIVRAKEDLPIFYTSIARLSGSTTVTASGGFNAQLKTASPTDMSGLTTTTTNATAGNTLTTVKGSTTTPTTTVTTVPPTGGNTTVTTPGGTTNTMSTTSTIPVTTATTAIANAASHAVTSGGDIYMPSIGGQVVSGPSFDINILDTQQFYQGILGDIPFSTVETFIDQEYDNQVLMRLFIERLEFRLKEITPNYSHGHVAGESLGTLHNYSYGKDEANDEAGEFANYIACVSLSGASDVKQPKILAAVSRVAEDANGATHALGIRDLALLDGDKFDVATQVNGKLTTERGYIGDPATDATTYIVRAAPEKRVPRFTLRNCQLQSPVSTVVNPSIGSYSSHDPSARPRYTPLGPPPEEAKYVGLATVRVTGDDGKPEYVAAKVDIIFRSPEGVIKFLGRYLRAADEKQALTYTLDGYPLLEVKEGSGGNAGVSTEIRGTRYYIDRGNLKKHEDEIRYRRYMSVLGLVQELVNLQKSSSDHPVTVPVHVLQ
jgi:hypothetical protein